MFPFVAIVVVAGTICMVWMICSEAVRQARQGAAWAEYIAAIRGSGGGQLPLIEMAAYLLACGNRTGAEWLITLLTEGRVFGAAVWESEVEPHFVVPGLRSGTRLTVADVQLLNAVQTDEQANIALAVVKMRHEKNGWPTRPESLTRRTRRAIHRLLDQRKKVHRAVLGCLFFRIPEFARAG